MLGRSVNYLLPLFLVAIEWIVRLSSKTDSTDLLGPTLAAVGIGYIIPATVVKTVELHVFDNITEQEKEVIATQMRARGLSFVPEKDRNYAIICLIALFAMMVLWLLDIYLVKQRPNLTFIWVKSYIWVGLLNMIIGFVLSEAKEKIVT